MTVSTTASTVTYTGTGLVTAYAVPFLFHDNSHIVATRTVSAVASVLVLGTDYTLTGAGVDGGGTLTLTTALASGATLKIERTVPFSQAVDFRTQGDFSAATHMAAFDRAAMMAQQLARDVDALELGTPILLDSRMVTAAGTTTQRTLADRFADVFNVKDFQATGNGVADDTPKIQAALTAAAVRGVRVLVPAGTYKVTSPLLLPSNVTLEGEGRGSVLQVSGTGVTCLLATSVSNVTIRKLRIVGSGAGVGSGCGIDFVDVATGSISDCLAESFEHHGIILEKSATGCTDVVVERCTVTGMTKATAGAGIGSNRCARTRVVNCVATGNRIGITFNDTTDGLMQANLARGNSEIGLTIDGVATNAGLSARNVVSNNQAVGNGFALGAVPGSTLYGGIYLGNYGADTAVVGNLSTGNAGDGIRCYGGVAGTILSGNNCRDNAHAGIALSGCGNVLVSGNTCRANGYQGVDVYRSYDVTVGTNILISNDTGASRSGLRVMDTDQCTVTSNRIANHTHEVEVSQTSLAAYDAAVTYGLNSKATYGGRAYRSLQFLNLAHTPDSSPTWWVAMDPPIYDAAVTYAAGDTVTYSINVYQSLQAANLAHTPGFPSSDGWWKGINPVSSYLNDCLVMGNILVGTHTSVISDSANKGVFANNIVASGSLATWGADGAWLKKALSVFVQSWNPGSLAVGATYSTTVTVTGAAVRDLAFAAVADATLPAGYILRADVISADTVQVAAYNGSAGVYDMASQTLRVVVVKL